MRNTLGPLDATGRISRFQQTRIATFLMSAHGAEARLLAAALLMPPFAAREIELHAQLSRELEILSLLTRATLWQADPPLLWLLWRWEVAWLPQPVADLPGVAHGSAIDAAAFGYALHTAIRPATVLPDDAPMTDPFVVALRRIEFESSRIVQAQLRFLKSPDLAPAREAISVAVDRRHQQIREFWRELLAGIGVEQES